MSLTLSNLCLMLQLILNFNFCICYKIFLFFFNCLCQLYTLLFYANIPTPASCFFAYSEQSGALQVFCLFFLVWSLNLSPQMSVIQSLILHLLWTSGKKKKKAKHECLTLPSYTFVKPNPPSHLYSIPSNR